MNPLLIAVGLVAVVAGLVLEQIKKAKDATPADPPADPPVDPPVEVEANAEANSNQHSDRNTNGADSGDISPSEVSTDSEDSAISLDS